MGCSLFSQPSFSANSGLMTGVEAPLSIRAPTEFILCDLGCFWWRLTLTIRRGSCRGVELFARGSFCEVELFARRSFCEVELFARGSFCEVELFARGSFCEVELFAREGSNRRVVIFRIRSFHALALSGVSVGIGHPFSLFPNHYSSLSGCFHPIGSFCSLDYSDYYP